MMKFRKATLDDLNELVKIRVEMRNEREVRLENCNIKLFQTNAYEYFRINISNNKYISWIAEDNGEIIATSGICFYTVPPTYHNISGKVGYIMNMYTKRKYRRRGIAIKLLEYLVIEAKTNHCEMITLNASDMGRPLYEKYGFKNRQDEMIFYINEV